MTAHSISYRKGLLVLGTLLGGFPLTAEEPSTAELLAELQALKTRVTQLEGLVRARQEADPGPTVPAPPPDPSSRAAEGSPSAPGPALHSPARKPLELTFYGYIKADMFYETQDTNLDAIPYWVCPDGFEGNNKDGEFGLTAKESRFGVKMRGPELGGGVLRGQFEFDFYGNMALSAHHAYTPRSRHAYLEWEGPGWSFLAGSTWEAYLITLPQTVNFSAYNFQGQLGLRRTQARLTRTVELSGDRHVQVRLALAEPLAGVHGADLDLDGQDDGADADVPFFEYNLEYGAGDARFAVAGFYGREHVEVMGATASRDYEAWAVIAGGEMPLGAAFSLRGSIWTGENLDSAWGGIGQGVNPLQGTAVAASGGWIQLQWSASPRLKLNLGYGLDDPVDSDLNQDQRTRNESLLVNGFYQWHENLSLGLELLRLRTGYKGQSTAEALRLQSMVKYQF